MSSQPFLLHALSPLHPGTGQGVGVIDLPIARMKATGIPFLPGSSIKGVVRDASVAIHGDGPEVLAAFGPGPEEKDPEKHHAGALSFGDGRLLLLPVRSLRGTFAWVTSPLLVRLATQDGVSLPECPAPDGAPGALVAVGSILETSPPQSKVFLEDIDLVSTVDPGKKAAAGALAACLAKWLFGDEGDQIFVKRLCIVDDDTTMSFLWETATQIDARNRIGADGVVAKGQLWWEESLPAETVLVGLASATGSRRRGVEGGPDHFLGKYLVEANLQFGGKSTVGRGRARIVLPRT